MKRLLLAAAVLLSLALPVFGRQTGKEWIVSLKSGQSIAKLNRDLKTAVVKHIKGSDIYLLRQEGNETRTRRKLSNHEGVEAVELNARIELDDSESTIFLLDDSESTIFLLDKDARTILNGVDVPKIYAQQPALSLIEANKVRSISTGAATRVATIDTGVDFNHPALRPWLDAGVDLVNGRSASEYDGLALADSESTIFLLDEDRTMPTAFGHGTLVAGLIHLVAPDAVIVPIKAFDAYGNTSSFTIVESVYHAMEMNVDVINMSFSTSQYSPALRDAINKARGVGITVVSSMGNGGQDLESVYPAAYTGVFGVAATDHQDHLAPFSNFGKTVSISAPGVYIVSTVPGGRYAMVAGTSFSTPLVSGTISLLASLRNRGNSPGPAVMNTAESIDTKNPGFEKMLGKGRVNVRRALEQK